MTDDTGASQLLLYSVEFEEIPGLTDEIEAMKK